MDRLDGSPPHGSNANSTNAIAPVLGTATAIHPDGPQRLGLIREESRTPPNSETSSLTDRPAQNWTESDPLATTTATTTATTPSAIRRIRHAEVIFRYSNYWLRLRWPGTNGGFAGYVCLVAHTNTMPRNIDVGQKVKDTGEWGMCVLVGSALLDATSHQCTRWLLALPYVFVNLTDPIFKC